MSRRIIFKSTKIQFPPRCVVCQARATNSYEYSRTVNVGNQNYPVSIPAPVCADHYRAASEKGAREQLISRAGLSLGIIAGGLTLYGLLRLWSITGEGVPILNLFVAGFVGISVLLLIWSVTNFFLAPLLAGPQVVAARHAVRILRYWPRSDQVQLEFSNDRAADDVAASNPDLVVIVH